MGRGDISDVSLDWRAATLQFLLSGHQLEAFACPHPYPRDEKERDLAASPRTLMAIRKLFMVTMRMTPQPSAATPSPRLPQSRHQLSDPSMEASSTF